MVSAPLHSLVTRRDSSESIRALRLQNGCKCMECEKARERQEWRPTTGLSVFILDSDDWLSRTDRWSGSWWAWDDALIIYLIIYGLVQVLPCVGHNNEVP